MRIDIDSLRRYIGEQLLPVQVEIEKGLIRRFARVIGETNLIHFDEAVAKQCGYRSLVAPLTFFTCLEEMTPPAMAAIAHLGLDPTGSLHAGQQFRYFEPICAGDTITIREEIVDIVSKKQGSLILVVSECTGTNQFDQVAVRTRATNLIRNEG